MPEDNKSLSKIKKVCKFTTLALFKIIKTPLRLSFLVSFLFILLLLPWPFQVQEFWPHGYARDQKVEFRRLADYSETLKPFLQISDLLAVPSQLRYYDLHIEIPKNNPGTDELFEPFSISIEKDHPLQAYMRKSLEPSDYPEYNDGVKTFQLRSDRKYVLVAVPISIPVIYGGIFRICSGTISRDCSEITDVDFKTEEIKIYAKPNIYSLIIQVLLIYSFCTIIINSFLDIYHKKW